MEISIIQSNIADEQLITIFAQILLSTVHKQSFCLKDCFTVSIYFFCFCSTTGDALRGFINCFYLFIDII